MPQSLLPARRSRICVFTSFVSPPALREEPAAPRGAFRLVTASQTVDTDEAGRGNGTIRRLRGVAPFEGRIGSRTKRTKNGGPYTIQCRPEMRYSARAIWISAVLSVLFAGDHSYSESNSEASKFRVTLLGTGTPNPSAHRFGPGTLVEAGGQRLVFDAGRGATIRLEQTGVPTSSITAVFLTHFHSDHVTGLSDLWLTGWVLPPGDGRREPFELYGPKGTEDLAAGLESAHAADIRIRIADERMPPKGAAISAHDITEGVVYDKEGVRVTAFEVDHGKLIKPAVGYRVDYDNRSVVVSGDTRYSPNLVKYADGADVLVHEVMSAPDAITAKSEAVRRIMDHHTSPEDAGRVFTQTGVRLAVYSHIIARYGYKDEAAGVQDLIRRTRTTYSGELVIGKDLMRIEVGETPRVVEAE